MFFFIAAQKLISNISGEQIVLTGQPQSHQCKEYLDILSTQMPRKHTNSGNRHSTTRSWRARSCAEISTGTWLLSVATQQPRYNGLLHQTYGRPLSAGMYVQSEQQAKIPPRPEKQKRMMKDAQYNSLCQNVSHSD